jgi:hypothetical protein
LLAHQQSSLKTLLLTPGVAGSVYHPIENLDGHNAAGI